MQAVRAERKKAVPTRQKRRRQERKNRLRQRQPRRNRGGANQRACNEEKTCFGGNKAAKAAQAADAPVFRRARGRRAFGKGGQKAKKRDRTPADPFFFAFAGAKVVFPIVPPSGGAVCARAGFPSRRSGKIKRRPYPRTPLFFRFMVFTTHHCRRLFQKVIRDESILTLFNHFVTSCRLNPRFRDIFLFLYRFAFSPLINSESLSGSRSFCARISCAFYCADLTPSDLKAQSLRFRS